MQGSAHLALPFRPPAAISAGSGTSSQPSAYASSTASPAAVAGPSRGLQLPKAGRPNGSSGPSKKRKLNGSGLALPRSAYGSAVNDSRELDERDDVDDADIMEAPILPRRAGRGLDENYDEDEEGDEVEAEGEELDLGEGEGDAQLVSRDNGQEAEFVSARGPTGAAAAAAAGNDDPATLRGTVGMLKKKDAPGMTEAEAEAVKAKTRAMKGDQITLRDVLDPEAAKRFDTFTGVIIPRAAIRKLNREIYDQTCPEKLSQYLAGIAKIFVAELTEIAKDLQPHSAYPTGPLRPYHLRLARQVAEERGLLGPSTSRESAVLRPKKGLFKR